MALAFNKFNTFVQDVGRKVHNLNADTLKIMLSNTAPAATNAVTADITEIAAGNGYSAGGAAVTGQSYTQTSGTAKLLATGATWTATGAIGPFRYLVLVNTTVAGGALIGWWDRGASLTLQNGETYTPTIDPTNGALQFA
jgi:hypothetical protein